MIAAGLKGVEPGVALGELLVFRFGLVNERIHGFVELLFRASLTVGFEE